MGLCPKPRQGGALDRILLSMEYKRATGRQAERVVIGNGVEPSRA